MWAWLPYELVQKIASLAQARVLPTLSLLERSRRLRDTAERAAADAQAELVRTQRKLDVYARGPPCHHALTTMTTCPRPCGQAPWAWAHVHGHVPMACITCA